MLTLSKIAQTLPASPIRKLVPFAEQAKKRGVKVYHLNIGQPDIIAPEVALNAVKENTLKLVEYPNSAGNESYRKGLARYYQNIGIDVDVADINITTGGSEALQIALTVTCNPDDEVIVMEPFYTNYNAFALISNVKFVPISTSIDNGFAIPSVEEFEKLITPKTKGIIICNPCNPTGVLYSKDEIEKLGEIARKHNLFIYSDEVYREFCYDDKFGVPTMGRFRDIDDNLVIVDSVSKRFSACGARVGCVVTRNKQLQAALLKFCQSRLAVATMDQVGAAALYSVDQSFYDNNRAEYVRRRDLVYDRLKNIPGVLVTKPEGAFYIMAALPVDDTRKFQNWLLTSFDDNGDTVMFAPGGPFYETPGKGVNEVRIAYVLCLEDLSRAMDLLEKGIARYRKEVMGVE